jgi:hypothetical protein
MALTVNRVCAAFLRWAKPYYQPSDTSKPSSELHEYKFSIRPLCSLYGTRLVKEFGPLALKALQQEMTKLPITPKVNVKGPDSKPVIDPATGKRKKEIQIVRVCWHAVLLISECSASSASFAGPSASSSSPRPSVNHQRSRGSSAAAVRLVRRKRYGRSLSPCSRTPCRTCLPQWPRWSSCDWPRLCDRARAALCAASTWT